MLWRVLRQWRNWRRERTHSTRGGGFWLPQSGLECPPPHLFTTIPTLSPCLYWPWMSMSMRMRMKNKNQKKPKRTHRQTNLHQMRKNHTWSEPLNCLTGDWKASSQGVATAFQICNNINNKTTTTTTHLEFSFFYFFLLSIFLFSWVVWLVAGFV